MIKAKNLRLLVLGAVVSVLGCSGGASPDAEPKEIIAPDFTLLDLQGNQVRLADFHGEVRLIDFWATWCAPCKEEIPMMNELQQTYGDAGFRILAITEESAEIVSDFVKAKPMNYTNLVGPEEYEEIASQYGVFSLPTAFLVDGEGRIVADFRGTKSRKALEGKIRELLGMPPLT
jgi:thiol-disulfide isomerase/thioredoxin